MDGRGISSGCEGLGGDGSRIGGRGRGASIGKRGAGAAGEADADDSDGAFGSFGGNWVLGGVAARAPHKEAVSPRMSKKSLLCLSFSAPQFRPMRTHGRWSDPLLIR